MYIAHIVISTEIIKVTKPEKLDAVIHVEEKTNSKKDILHLTVVVMLGVVAVLFAPLPFQVLLLVAEKHGLPTFCQNA